MLEIIAVLVVVGVILSLVLGRMNQATNPDAITDLDTIRSVTRLAQIKSMGDATTSWSVAVSGRNLTLSQGNTVMNTYALRSSFGTFSVGFTNKGVPQNQSGTWPFTINATTGYIQ